MIAKWLKQIGKGAVRTTTALMNDRNYDRLMTAEQMFNLNFNDLSCKVFAKTRELTPRFYCVEDCV